MFNVFCKLSLLTWTYSVFISNLLSESVAVNKMISAACCFVMLIVMLIYVWCAIESLVPITLNSIRQNTVSTYCRHILNLITMRPLTRGRQPELLRKIRYRRRFTSQSTSGLNNQPILFQLTSALSKTEPIALRCYCLRPKTV